MNQTHALSWFSFPDFLASRRLPGALSNSHVRLVVCGGQKDVLCVKLLNAAPKLLSQHDMPSGDMDCQLSLHLAYGQCRVTGSLWWIEREGIALVISALGLIKQVREET